MANKAKHAFGSSENIVAALQAGTINERDILFLDEDTDNPKVGWITKDGEVVIAAGEESVVVVEDALPSSGEPGKVYIFNENGYFWNGVEFVNFSKPTDVTALEAEIATKADSVEVDEKINTAVTDTVATAKAYTDGKVESAVEAAMSEHLVKRYEVTDVPAGTLVDYFDKEIRIMCPANAEFVKQAVGVGGDANSYYMTFKTYVPDDSVVGYIEHLNDKVDEEILTDIKTDEFGRRYQPTWLALAKYEDATGWTYYGSSSSTEKYIGWNYQIDWYNADGVMVKSDVLRINLSNEDCHNAIEPYYMGSMMEQVNSKIEEKIAEVEGAIEVVEF